MESIVERNPDSAQDHCALAIVRALAGRFASGVSAFERALELGVANAPAAHNELAWLLATCRVTEVRNAESAVKHAEAAVAARPKNASYKNTLGIAYYRAGRHREAVRTLRRSMAGSKGGSVLDWLFLAMALHRLDGEANRTEARQLFDRATRKMDERKNAEHMTSFQKEAARVLGVRASAKERR
jgi:tetratricopeptide (TPR) repeat protein